MPSVGGIYFDDDECSYDSTDSPVHIRHQDVMKAACIQWRNSLETIRGSWRKRADFLNTLPVPGRLNNITGSRTIIEKQMIEAVYLDWKNLCRKFRASIKNTPRKELSSMKYFFGKEEVQIYSQTYRHFVISALVRFRLFGEKCEKVARFVVMESKKRVLLHIASQECAKHVFTIANLCATEVELDDSNIILSCCGKVSIKFLNKGSKTIIGYIMNEDRGRWSIKLKDNSIIRSRPAKYIKEDGTYMFPIQQNSRKGYFVINQYWPIRVLIYTRGEIRFTLNRIGYRKDTLISQHCS